MSDPINGREGLLKLGNHSVNLLKEWSITDTMKIDESTCKTSDYSFQFPGIKKWDATAKLLMDPSDVDGQMVLDDAYNNRTKITDIKFILDGATGYYAPDLVAESAAGCYIKSRKVNSPESGAVTFDLEISGSGPLKFFPAI